MCCASIVLVGAHEEAARTFARASGRTTHRCARSVGCVFCSPVLAASRWCAYEVAMPASAADVAQRLRGLVECSGGHGFDDTLKGDGRRARRDWNRDWNRDWSELAPLRATEEGRGVTGTVTEGRP